MIKKEYDDAKNQEYYDYWCDNPQCRHKWENMKMEDMFLWEGKVLCSFCFEDTICKEYSLYEENEDDQETIQDLKRKSRCTNIFDK